MEAGHPEQLLRYTGGWAGIVDVILRLESKYGAWNPESCWHEMNRYIKEIILDTLQREEREILHLAQYLPWVDEEMCEEILGTAHESNPRTDAAKRVLGAYRGRTGYQMECSTDILPYRGGIPWTEQMDEDREMV